MSEPSNESRPAGPPHRIRRVLWLLGKRVMWIVLWLCPLTLLGLILLYATPVGTAVGAWLTCVDPLNKADAIVVLGGQIDRAVEAARLYHEGYAPRVVVSSFPEDRARYLTLLEICNIPPDAIDFDPNPLRTQSHPATIARIDGIGPSSKLLIVTSRFHTRRAGAVFRRAGYEQFILRCPRWELDPPRDRSRTGLGIRSTPYAVYELLGLAYYKLLGWI